MKIFVSTIEKTANIQVVELNAYLISKIIRAQVTLESALRKRVKTQWNEGKDEPVLDENGNPTYIYDKVDSKTLDEKVLPILTELVEAFEA